MNQPALSRFRHSRTARLAASYLLIIMVLSVGFSFVFYQTSAHELGRRVPPTALFNRGPEVFTGGPDYTRFFQRRIDEGRSALLGKLIFLNLLALVGGAALSYYLARQTLQPIESAMAAQARFVTDASHELRTPLTAILTSNEVALRKPALTLPQAKDVITSNLEDVARLKGLSDGLLSLAKQDGADLVVQAVSLQTIAGEAMNQVIAVAQAKQITIDDAVPDVKVLGDQAALVQAAVILLDNAIKYSPDKRTIHLAGHAKDGHGCFTVRDEGSGISEQDLPHIFDRFYRADTSRTTASSPDGYGLGLSIARQIIDRHQGRIVVSSTPGQGAAFTLELPLAAL